MTEGIIYRINAFPEYVLSIDWMEETDGFSHVGISTILMGIISNEVCDWVGERIAMEWYEACEGIEDERLMSVDGYGNRIFRFESDDTKEISGYNIESYIKKVKQRRLKKIESDNKIKQLLPTLDTHENTHRRGHRGATPRDERSQYIIEQRDQKIASLTEEIELLKQECNDMAERLKEAEESKKKIERRAARRATQWLVQQLIIYAEKEKVDCGREIKWALQTKIINSVIEHGVLDDEWKHRLENLGRERQQPIMVQSENTQIIGSRINTFNEGGQ